jgi:hypothetical protein
VMEHRGDICQVDQAGRGQHLLAGFLKGVFAADKSP